MQLLALCFYGVVGSGALAAAGMSWIAARFASRRQRAFEFTDSLLVGGVAGALGVVPVTLACITIGMTNDRGSQVGAIVNAVLFGLVEGALVGSLAWGVHFSRERSRRGIATGRQN